MARVGGKWGGGIDRREPTRGGNPPQARRGYLISREALRQARKMGHMMQYFRAAPGPPPGERFVSWCRVCDASLIWRTRPVGFEAVIEGTSLTRACVGVIAPKKRVDTKT